MVNVKQIDTQLTNMKANNCCFLYFLVTVHDNYLKATLTKYPRYFTSDLLSGNCCGSKIVKTDAL